MTETVGVRVALLRNGRKIDWFKWRAATSDGRRPLPDALSGQFWWCARAFSTHSLRRVCECMWKMMMMGARNLVHFKWLSDFAPLSRVCAFCRLFVFLMRADTWRTAFSGELASWEILGGSREKLRRAQGVRNALFLPTKQIEPIGFGALPNQWRLSICARCSWESGCCLRACAAICAVYQVVKIFDLRAAITFPLRNWIECAMPWDWTLDTFASFLQFNLRHFTTVWDFASECFKCLHKNTLATKVLAMMLVHIDSCKWCLLVLKIWYFLPPK